MKRKQRGTINRPWTWCAVLVSLSAVVGVWNAQEIDTRQDVQADSTTVSRHEEIDLEQIEATLAQAGCPGWMVLAGEGESALETRVLPSDVRETRERVPSQYPRVRYPVPVRVASRTASTTSIQGTNRVGSPDDPNDLLDGVPDLLLETSEPEQ